MAVVSVETLQLDVLVVVEMLASLFGWGFAYYYSQVTIRRMTSFPVIEGQGNVDAKVKQFLKPSFFAVSFSSLAHNLNVFGSSLFATNVSIAAFGVFQKLIQIFIMFAGPLIPYGARKLRLISESTDKRRKEILLIYGAVLLYGGYAFLCIIFYHIAGGYFQHYSLNY